MSTSTVSRFAFHKWTTGWNFLTQGHPCFSMQYYEILILLYRPFIQPNDAPAQSPALQIPAKKALEICMESATEISQLLKIHCRHFGIARLNVYSVHILMTAALIHVFVAGDRSNPRQAEAQAAARESIQALSELSHTFESSTRAFEVITSIRLDWQDEMLHGQRSHKRRRN